MRYQRKKTPMIQKEASSKRWFVFDAAGKTLGRFVVEVCRVLRGKHSCDFSNHFDCGEGVIVLNASKIKVTGNKEIQKVYRRYSGFMGGLKEFTFNVVMSSRPDRIIVHAVKGMMPKTKLAARQLKRLRVFAGSEHGMDAQQPISLDI